MATIDTVYQVWFKRQNRKEGESIQQYCDEFEHLVDAQKYSLLLQEEDVNIWKIHKITEHVETVK